eukprot:6064215-Pleurochrysis_carterae.AAC.1
MPFKFQTSSPSSETGWWRLSTIVQVGCSCMDKQCRISGAILSPLSQCSDEWDYTSHPQIDGNSANHHPFPGHELTMPGFDPNHLAHQQPHVVMRRAAGF